MIGLREIPRTAAFTWSPDVISQTLATGTKAGAVDEGFSNDTQLELWDLALDDTNLHDIKPIASVSTDSRFNDIAWTKNSALSSRGLIAGALENGSLDLWDAERLISAQPDAFLSRSSKHSGAIKALQFNPFRTELLGTVGAKGELFISDVNNVGNPFRMGNAVARADDFECLDWNKRTSHIMVTGSSGGIITVWDIKNKRESLTLNNLGRRPVSAVAWDPVKTTRLMTAIPSDSDPLILVWDLRNANAPERVLRGHDGGVLSLSWCQQDSNLLLSCGKDNRTICWNPQTGESLGEFPIVTNWTFQTRWNPRNPNFVATASFDGKISINAIQNAKSDQELHADVQGQAVDDEDFFSKAQSQSSGAKFSLMTPPSWLQRPCGATFAFGGKLATFKSSQGDAQRRSIVRISQYSVDKGIVTSTEAFESSLTKGNLQNICDMKISAASDGPDRHDWQVIKLLTVGDTKKELAGFLGFTSSEDTGLVNGGAQSLASDSIEDHGRHQENKKQPAVENNRLSAFFDGGGDSDNFLSELAATKGAKTNSPFRIYSGSESVPDRQITNALLSGKFEDALDVCVAEGRISDAFMIAICGGQPCIDKAQKAYFKQGDTAPNYLRLLASIVGKNLWDLVHNADLDNWKEIIVTICTYANTSEFQDLCEALGDRLEERITIDTENEVRKNAALCFLAGSKLEKVVAIWLAELRQKEVTSTAQSSHGSGFSLYARLLQNFIEKVTVFREVTQYKDKDRDAPSNWRLAPLYEKYVEYADLASAHGQLQVAERYLDLLPSQYAAAEVAKARVKNALKKPAAQDAARQSALTGRTSQRLPVGGPQPQLSGSHVSSSQPSQYAPATAASNPYAPASSQQYSAVPYSGTGFNVQQQQQPPPQPGMAYTLQSGPPGAYGRGATGSPSIPPPPSKISNVGNWNDMPDSFFKPPTASRRGTPVANANGSYQTYQNAVPPIQPAAPPPKITSALGPPPRAGTGTTRVDTPPQPSQIDRPPSSAANPYAPSMNSLPIDAQPKINRGPSPYNAPPSAAPPNNRYAPAQRDSSPQVENITASPGVRQAAPPANPYAPKQPATTGAHAALLQQRGPPPAPPLSKINGPPPVAPQSMPLGGGPPLSSNSTRSPAPKYRKLDDIVGQFNLLRLFSSSPR